jgi:hypothetical protein
MFTMKTFIFTAAWHRAIIAALALAGCATAPLPRIEVRTVSILVPVACIAAADVPQRPAKLARPLPDGADALLSLALARLLKFEGYADHADAVMRPCTVVPENPAV